MSGNITVITGCMFAGKTSRLLKLARKHREDGQNVLIFKPHIDIRSGDSLVKTHDDDGEEAIVLHDVRHIMTHSQPGMILALDEAQFFEPEALLTTVQAVVESGAKVVIAVLDRKWSGDFFPGVPALKDLADNLIQLHARCVCGGEADYSHRLSASTDDVEVGSGYVPMCETCFQTANSHQAS